MTERLDRDVADVARKWVPDPRLGVLEVSVEPQRLAGCTTSREALAALRRIAADAGRAADIRLLPDASVRDEPAAVVTAAVAPLLREPRIAADRVSEALHGEPLALLERREEGGVRLRVRAGGECERRCRPAGIGAPSGGAAPRTAGVGAALVLGRALSVGRPHRVGHRLLRPSPGNLRGPGNRAPARLGPAVARGPGGEDRRRGLGLRGGRSVVLRGWAPGFPCRPLGGGGSDRALRAGARRRRIGRPARRDARREAAA